MKESPFVIIVVACLAYRELLRKHGLFEEADKIRDALIAFGINIEDKK